MQTHGETVEVRGLLLILHAAAVWHVPPQWQAPPRTLMIWTPRGLRNSTETFSHLFVMLAA